MHEWYYGWWYNPKRMTKRQIQEMIRNMQKSSIVNKKSKEYHKREEIEADNILKDLNDKA